MSIPRWTVYPALLVVLGLPLLVVATPKTPKDPNVGAALAARSETKLPPSKFPRVVVLGIDGLDPDLLEEAIQRYPERTRNFQR